MEISNEKVITAVTESGKSQVETLEAILTELRLHREELKLGREENSKLGREMFDLQTTILTELQVLKEDSNRQLRETTRAFKDATSEMSTLCDDVTRQFRTLVAAVKASRYNRVYNIFVGAVSRSHFKDSVVSNSNVKLVNFYAFIAKFVHYF